MRSPLRARRTTPHPASPHHAPARRRSLAVVVPLLLLGSAVAVPTAVAAGAPEPAPAALGAASWSVTPAAFGAVGNGQTDDTAALRRALTSLGPGGELYLPPGKVYRHTDTLRITTRGTTISGTGTLMATDPQRSAVIVQADDVSIRDVTLRLGTPTTRLGTFDHMKLTVLNADGFLAERVKVDGAAAAGVYLWGASDFVLRDLDVKNSRADGIHVTGPSRDGIIDRPLVRSSGDDGVAVVSYLQDGAPVKRVTVARPTVRTTTWGRGVSVVGGEDVTVTDLTVEGSSAAAVYVAREGAPWNTFAPVRVRVQGGTISRANTSTTVDHGAVLVYDGRTDANPLREVTIADLTITDTRSTASRQVGFLRGTSGATGVHLTGLKIVRGPGHLLTVDAGTGTWEATGWTRNGVPVPDRR